MDVVHNTGQQQDLSEEPNIDYNISCKYLYVHKRIPFLKKKVQNMFRDKYKI